MTGLRRIPNCTQRGSGNISAQQAYMNTGRVEIKLNQITLKKKTSQTEIIKLQYIFFSIEIISCHYVLTAAGRNDLLYHSVLLRS